MRRRRGRWTVDGGRWAVDGGPRTVNDNENDSGRQRRAETVVDSSRNIINDSGDDSEDDSGWQGSLRSLQRRL